MDSLRLPNQIEVKIKKEKDGTLFAELPEFGVFTEADSVGELIFNVNDLIYSFFDVKSSSRGKFCYLPHLKKQIEAKHQINSIPFLILTVQI